MFQEARGMKPMAHQRPLIVVAREDSQARASLGSLLSGQGYEVAAFPTLPESSEFIRNRKPVLVLTDRPGAPTTGIEILEQIKSLSPHTEGVFLPGARAVGDEGLAARSDQEARILRIVDRLLHRVPLEVLFTRQAS
jgi:response regulator RpfG family c-di-GMP phosphodiesterase